MMRFLRVWRPVAASRTAESWSIEAESWVFVQAERSSTAIDGGGKWVKR